MDYENGADSDTDHASKNEESFYKGTGNRKVRKPVVTFEVKEDNCCVNQNQTNWQVDIGHFSKSGVPKSIFDWGLLHTSATKHDSNKNTQFLRRRILAIEQNQYMTRPRCHSVQIIMVRVTIKT